MMIKGQTAAKTRVGDGRYSRRCLCSSVPACVLSPDRHAPFRAHNPRLLGPAAGQHGFSRSLLLSVAVPRSLHPTQADVAPAPSSRPARQHSQTT